MLLAAIASIVLGYEQVSVDVTPKFMSGVHFACEVSFESLVDDTAHHQGLPVAVSGSFSLYNWPDQSRLFVGMKLGVSADATQWTAPSDAYVINGYRSNLRYQRGQSEAENPGFRLFIFDLGGDETLAAISRLTSEGVLNVAYTLGDGSMPMTFPVDLSDEQARSWGSCVQALLARDTPKT